ncbi:centrosomal protein of 83 kDa-like [Scleropages formosus]|uniref:Centrosomal protein of 83 kDa-like n=1 Tax=Scleropages formosus TaxID=113540 RepID=A0A0P7WSW2_SCLFO|nr:centrosomal protein of 83 kDa-like [Scleropages formosus]
MNPSALSQTKTLFPNLDSGVSKAGALMGTPALVGADMELHKMLIDERMRCEHHKTNYQTLKAEHTRLQDEYVRVQNELKRLLSDKQSSQEQLQLLVAELRGELLDKTREAEELKLQVLSPQKLELLRVQIQQELDGPMRERFTKIEEEAEKYRTELNKLRYDYMFLKSECDHQREEHARVMEEKQLRFDAEICRLEKDKDELRAQLLTSDPTRDSKRVETLLREKAQLHLRLKSLEAEVAELRAERDSSGAQAENVQRIQVRQLAESQAAVKALEAEKQSLRLHLERLENELQLSQEQNNLITARLHKAEREVSALTSQVAEMKHTHKLEMANVRLECMRAKGELERERDALHSQVEGLQADMDILKEALERSKEHLAEKEREVIRKVQAARAEELHKTATVQEEKLELENRLSDLEQQRALQSSTEASLKEEWEERLRAAQLSEETARKEVQVLRTKVQQQALHLEDLEKAKAENADLRQVGTGHLYGSACPRSFAVCSWTLEDRRIEWLQEKHKLQEREAELQDKNHQARERLQRAALAQKKRKTMSEQKEKKLQDKIQLLEAKIAQLEIETSTAKKKTYSEEHANLHRRLKELQRRHSEFRRLLLGSSLVPGFPAATPLAGAELSFPGFSDEQHQRELAMLRRRLEELESSQQQQLEELGTPLERDRECQESGANLWEHPLQS